MAFNPVSMIYLYPELYPTLSNSVSKTCQYFAASNITENLIGNIERLPDKFDYNVFITDNRSNINVSSLNTMIRAAMLGDDNEASTLDRNGKFVTNIYQTATLVSTNIFRFVPTFSITESNLQVGDKVKLHRNKVETLYANVSSIDTTTNTVTMCNSLYQFCDIGTEYEVIGIKVCDPMRIATINYIRNSNVYIDTLNVYDPEFNPSLYKLLYPDAYLLDNVTSYLDFVSHYQSGDVRIGRTRDLINSGGSSNANANFLDVDSLTIHRNLNLDFCTQDGYVTWRGVQLAGVSQDNLTVAQNLSLVDENLITERAIKTYVDRKYNEVANFNDIVVNSNAAFKGRAIFDSNVEFRNHVQVTGPIEAFNVSRFLSFIASNADVDVLHVKNIIASGPVNFSNVNIREGHVKYAHFEYSCNNDLRAISAHVSNSATSNAIIRDHLEVLGTSMFNGTVDTVSDFISSSNAYFNGTTNISGTNNHIINAGLCNIVFGGAVDFSTDAHFDNNLISQGAYMGPRFGIGDLGIGEFPDVAGIIQGFSNQMYELANSNLNLDYLTVNMALNVPGHAYIGDSVNDVVLHVNGLIEATNVNLTSDVRLKTDIFPINDDHLLNMLINKDVQLKQFRYKRNQRPYIGFIAQELERAIPSAIITTPLYISRIDRMANVGMDFLNHRTLLYIQNHECAINDILVVREIGGPEYEVIIVGIINKNELQIGRSMQPRSVYVVGVKYTNVKCIDYQYLSMVMFGGIRSLHREIQNLRVAKNTNHM